MVFLLFAAIVGLLVFVCFGFWRSSQKAKRADYIRRFRLPPGLYDKLKEKHSHLTNKDCQLVGQGLRQFFLAYLNGNFRPVHMPSQVVDDLWHEFILYTKNYESFCNQAFARFLHHTPAAALKQSGSSNAGLRRCWWLTCKDENIDPKKPTRLPLLFALDSKLNIPNGFLYAPDCSGAITTKKSNGGCSSYCATDFSDTSFDGDLAGFGDAGFSGDSASDGGGDGGGCGGGCGGGGD